jgi:CheY-like chemotaxis protein
MNSPVNRTAFTLDFSSISFLIVDDQPFSRRLVRAMLTGFGSREVHESANGVEAFELARKTMPSIIITDLIMPLFNGLRFIRMAKDAESPTHRIPIIVLSGYLTKAAALTAKDSGADELLVNPVSPKVLNQHISRIVLRADATRQPDTFLQNQNRPAEQHRMKSGDCAYI